MPTNSTRPPRPPPAAQRPLSPLAGTCSMDPGHAATWHTEAHAWPEAQHRSSPADRRRLHQLLAHSCPACSGPSATLHRTGLALLGSRGHFSPRSPPCGVLTSPTLLWTLRVLHAAPRYPGPPLLILPRSLCTRLWPAALLKASRTEPRPRQPLPTQMPPTS